jgi:hypothetical protein
MSRVEIDLSLRTSSLQRGLDRLRGEAAKIQSSFSFGALARRFLGFAAVYSAVQSSVARVRAEIESLERPLTAQEAAVKRYFAAWDAGRNSLDGVTKYFIRFADSASTWLAATVTGRPVEEVREQTDRIARRRAVALAQDRKLAEQAKAKEELPARLAAIQKEREEFDQSRRLETGQIGSAIHFLESKADKALKKFQSDFSNPDVKAASLLEFEKLMQEIRQLTTRQAKIDSELIQRRADIPADSLARVGGGGNIGLSNPLLTESQKQTGLLRQLVDRRGNANSLVLN